MYFSDVENGSILMKIVLFFLFSLFEISHSASLDHIILMSEEFPPYNYREDGIPKGSSIEIIKLLIDKTKSKKKLIDISFYPWARSYTILQKEKNTALFAMTKTKDREDQFKWVGPISRAKNVILGLPSTEVRDNFKGNTFCVLQNDAGEQLLYSKLGVGKKNLNFTQSTKSCIHMVMAKRVDFFAYDLNVTNWYLKEESISPDKLKEFYLLEAGEHYIGFNKDTDDKIINDLQTTLNQLKKSGHLKIK